MEVSPVFIKLCMVYTVIATPLILNSQNVFPKETLQPSSFEKSSHEAKDRHYGSVVDPSQFHPYIGSSYPGVVDTLLSLGLHRPSGDQIQPTVDPKYSTESSTDAEERTSRGYEWERGEMFEGDIEMVNINNSSSISTRNGVINVNQLWPKGIVYYKFKGPNVNTKERNVVLWAMKHIQDRTCIRFQQQKTEKDFVSIQFESNGCSSNVGRTGGEQVVNLNKDYCFGTNGTAIHELLHILGFYHEQSRSDRNNFITILEKNIEKGKENNFAIARESSAQRVPYDYDSILHYSNVAFSVDGMKPTIVSKLEPGRKTFGNRLALTPFDALKINRLYKCPNRF